MSVNTTTRTVDADMSSEALAAAHRTTGVAAAIARYYAEFLSTDFKATRVPKRAFERKNGKGLLVGADLNRYDQVAAKAHKAMSGASAKPFEMEVRRGAHRTELPAMVRKVLDGTIERINLVQMNQLVEGITEKASRLVTGGEMDAEIFRDVFLQRAATVVTDVLSSSVLDSMGEHLKNAANRPAEDLISLGRGLGERLLGDLREKCVDALAALVVEDDVSQLRAVLEEHFELQTTKAAMKDFFEGFIASDLFVELVDMRRSQRMLENTEFFLYIGAITVDGVNYPLSFQRLELTEALGTLHLRADNQLYINKQAIDYAVELVGKKTDGEVGPSVVQERIYYLTEQASVFAILQPILDAMALACGVRVDALLAETSGVIASSSALSISNRISIALADKPDESILNDYEALLTGIQSDAESVDFFQAMVEDFLTKNPLSVHDQVEQRWEATSLSDRLVFESPLPLAEEQRKILTAVDLPDAQYVAVEGPPGTGKSHTITAIAFDAILKGKSLLILSDKLEALDVVEDKLNEALSKVRHKEDFQNPILRLGRYSGNYNRLMKKSTIEALEISRRMARSQESRLRAERNEEVQRLKEALEETTTALGQIEMKAIIEVYGLERDLYSDFPHLQELVEEQSAQVLSDFHLVFSYLNDHRERFLDLQGYAAGSLGLLRRVRQIADLIEQSPELRGKDLHVVRNLTTDKIAALRGIVSAIDNAKGVFGYLFAGGALRNISEQIEAQLGFRAHAPLKVRDDLITALQVGESLLERLQARGLDQSEFGLAYDLIRKGCPPPVPVEVLVAAERLEEASAEQDPLLHLPEGQTLLRGLLTPDEPSLEAIRRYAFVHAKLAALHEQFAKLPQIDYLGAKTRIESLYTHELAGVIDERLIRFYHHRRADAKTLGDIIRARGKFPADRFSLLKEAFPCMISGLREYAEFIPMERGIFDLVIIDEASQVSIAQAMPAILRAKKMVVLGDRKQFGNVKTALASKAINNSYMEEMRQSLTHDHRDDAYMRQRLERFNIKSSVMDFFDLVANYTIQLRKHFRSYPEMIGFSSQAFYDGSLQTMKIRGKPISDVIQFDAIDHDGKVDMSANTNELEIEHIFTRLEALLADESPYSAGIITPHSEQVTLINRMLDAHPRQDDFRSRLRLKVMNFDSCQGEERDVIFYSLVATREKDRLSHIFPASMDTAADDIEYNLRLQRLNVGFSRAKERIVIVHSKPIDQYRSALKSALFHYQNAVELAQRMPNPSEVDPHSPMELKVLSWLSQAPIIQKLGERVELHAQFPMGEYLRSLDPAYQHPAYRVDFLLRVNDGHSITHLVIEYDGFEYHFDTSKRGQIDGGNWQHYLTERDIERERVLESFGVKMVRLNRFVLGKSPVQTIDELLRQRLRDMHDSGSGHQLLEATKLATSTAEQGLAEGSHKHCRKCDQVKELDHFISPGTKTGFGRLCTSCRA